MEQIQNTDLGERIERLIEKSRRRTVAAVNTAMVYTYYEIGRMIVEDEQQGEQRAEYGTTMLRKVAERLTQKFGKGFFLTNLKQMRSFYLVYTTRTYEKSQTLSYQFKTLVGKGGNSETVSRNSRTPSEKLHFTLSWSHYLKLMRIENPEERRFYEIEATEKTSQNNRTPTSCGCLETKLAYMGRNNCRASKKLKGNKDRWP